MHRTYVYGVAACNLSAGYTVASVRALINWYLKRIFVYFYLILIFCYAHILSSQLTANFNRTGAGIAHNIAQSYNLINIVLT